MSNVIDATQRPEWAATQKPVPLAPDGYELKTDWQLVYADENARHWLDMNRVIRHWPNHFTAWLYSDDRTVPLAEYGLEISNMKGGPQYLELRNRHFRDGRWHSWSGGGMPVRRGFDDWESFDNADDVLHRVLLSVCDLLTPAVPISSNE